MKQTMTLDEVVSLSCSDDQTFEEITVPPDAVEFVGDEVRVNDRSWYRNQDALKRTYRNINAPGEFLCGLNPKIQGAVLAEAFGRGDCGETITITVRGGELYTICRGDLTRLTKSEVLAAVIRTLGEHAKSLSPTKIGMAGDLLDLELTTPRKSIDVRRGDAVQGGLHISHSVYGEQATVVETFSFRLVCLNGMMHRECPSQAGFARTRKLPLGHTNGKELQMEQVGRLVKQAWDRMEPLLQELRGTGERTADVEAVLTGWLQRARISTTAMMPRLREAWQAEGAENTQYGAINALTRVATHGDGLSDRQRRALASLAGLVAFSKVHICPRCFTVLSHGTTRGEDS
jgi:hypothetical protein